MPLQTSTGFFKMVKRRKISSKRLSMQFLQTAASIEEGKPWSTNDYLPSTARNLTVPFFDKIIVFVDIMPFLFTAPNTAIHYQVFYCSVLIYAFRSQHISLSLSLSLVLSFSLSLCLLFFSYLCFAT